MALGQGAPATLDLELLTLQAFRNQYLTLRERLAFINTERKADKAGQRGGKTSCVKSDINPLNAELNPICYLLALLGAHHFLHVSRIRVKSLAFRLLMLYIYMEHPFLMFLDHTQRRTTVGRTPLGE